MKTLKELYQIVLDNYDDDEYYTGICANIHCVYSNDLITGTEFSLLIEDFVDRKTRRVGSKCSESYKKL